ncbi:MAG: ABC transporter permease [Pseudomonadales bacterium]|nr:ABC transporter permease [Pseudomonadales bacterium]
MWFRLWVLVGKEFRQLFRDIPIMLIMVWAFTGAIYVAGHAIDLGINQYPIAIYDMDKSNASRELVSLLRKPYFKIVADLESDQQVAPFLDLGKGSLVVIIPPDFSRDIEGNNAQFQVISDGTQSQTAMLAISYIGIITNQYNMQLLLDNPSASLAGISAGSLPGIDSRVRVEYNPNIDHTWFTSLLEVFNMITLIGMLLTAAALVREKLYGTLDQLMVTPVQPLELFLAKIIPPLVLTMALSLVGLFVVVHQIFGTPLRGNILLFYGVAALYCFSISSLGLLIALFSRNIAQAMLILFMILIPMLFLSGAMTPPESMSPIMSYISLLSPMRYFMDFGYQVLFKGNGFAYVWLDIVGIIIFGTIIFCGSLWRFRKMIG